MRYRKTFHEAVKEVWAKAAKKKEEEKPVADEKPAEKEVEAKPAEDKGEDKDKTIESLKLKLGLLKQKLENERNKVVKPVPNKDTGEVPLRTGIAQAILDKKNGKVVAKKVKKEKVSIGQGQTKFEVDPEVSLGIGSGGDNTGSGNLH